MTNIHFVTIAVVSLTTIYLLYMYYKKNEKRLAIIENNIQKITQNINNTTNEIPNELGNQPKQIIEDNKNIQNQNYQMNMQNFNTVGETQTFEHNYNRDSHPLSYSQQENISIFLQKS